MKCKIDTQTHSYIDITHASIIVRKSTKNKDIV